eukprot:2498975-Rhodomonas_salina.1
MEYDSGSRPTLEKPWTFEGQYSELVNVLNWLTAVVQYVDQCSVSENRRVGYVCTYLSNLIQAWPG